MNRGRKLKTSKGVKIPITQVLCTRFRVNVIQITVDLHICYTVLSHDFLGGHLLIFIGRQHDRIHVRFDEV